MVDNAVVPRLDPKLDVVFKLLLTRAPPLLDDMLECILGRPVGPVSVTNPELVGERTADKRVIFDVRAVLADGSRVDLEMQNQVTPALDARLIYYTARDYGAQLHHGQGYHRLTPTTGIVWLASCLRPGLERLHSIIELRDRHTGARFSDQLSLHLLQLPHLPAGPSGTTGYTAQVERWARFLVADEHELDQLAAENLIMTLAKQTLEQLSLDPKALLLALEREAEVKLYEIELAASQQQGLQAGHQRGEATIVLKQLRLRFGDPSPTIEARVREATTEQLETWAERLLTAATLDQVFEP